MRPVAIADLTRRVRAALDTVTDPCSQAVGAPAGLCEMGLVRSVEATPGPGGAAVSVVLTLTDAGCLLGAEFVARAEERVAALPGVADVEVRLDHRMDWSPGDMDPAYRDRLAVARRRRM